jgi:hypothetical protein
MQFGGGHSIRHYLMISQKQRQVKANRFIASKDFNTRKLFIYRGEEYWMCIKG